jgi:DNA-binding response OmpR family regulator
MIKIIKYQSPFVKQQSVDRKNVGPMDRNSILVLDDEYDIVAIVKSYLERERYSVFGFTDPLMALEHFNTNYVNYGLVISDLRMPAMNGFDFIKGVKQIRSEVKVLLMSAFSVEDDSDFTMRFKSYNIDGFIQKPFSIRQLNNIVKKHV